MKRAAVYPALADAPPRFLANARAAGRRMMDMIDDLLNVSQFEAGELRPAAAPSICRRCWPKKNPPTAPRPNGTERQSPFTPRRHYPLRAGMPG